MSRQIDYYFSFQSPWAYIGHGPFTEVARRFAVRVNYKPVPLVDLFSETGGLPLAKRHPARQRYRLMELQRWREKRGLTFHLQPAHWPFNPGLADGLAITAQQAGYDPTEYSRLAFAGIWEQELDLADPKVIAGLADQAGLPGELLLERAQSEAARQTYEQNQRDAKAADVFGSPAYVLDGEVFWGQDRIDLLADALESGRPPYRP